MKIRTDFVTNSSSSSFTVQIIVEPVEGKPAVCRLDSYDEENVEIYHSLFVHLSPRQLCQSGSIDELLAMLKKGVTGVKWKDIEKAMEEEDADVVQDVDEWNYEKQVFDDDGWFIKGIREFGDIKNIARIQIGCTVDSNVHNGLYYSYDNQTGEYETMGIKEDSTSGSLKVPDASEAEAAVLLEEQKKGKRKIVVWKGSGQPAI